MQADRNHREGTTNQQAMNVINLRLFERLVLLLQRICSFEERKEERERDINIVFFDYEHLKLP